jgi:hypothetical protein
VSLGLALTYRLNPLQTAGFWRSLAHDWRAARRARPVRSRGRELGFLPVAGASNYVSTWEKVLVIATAVGGIGAMLSAIFSWLAARRSGQTARDARDALAASLKPQVHLLINQWDQSIEARAVVTGPLSPLGTAKLLPATDLHIEFSSATGKHGSASMATLEPNPSIWAQEPPYLNVVIGKVSDGWPPLEGGQPEHDHVTANVTYSDVRGVGTYRQSMSVDLMRYVEQQGGQWVVSFRNPTEPTETRITP